MMTMSVVIRKGRGCGYILSKMRLVTRKMFYEYDIFAVFALPDLTFTAPVC